MKTRGICKMFASFALALVFVFTLVPTAAFAAAEASAPALTGARIITPRANLPGGLYMELDIVDRGSPISSITVMATDSNGKEHYMSHYFDLITLHPLRLRTGTHTIPLSPSFDAAPGEYTIDYIALRDTNDQMTGYYRWAAIGPDGTKLGFWEFGDLRFTLTRSSPDDPWPGLYLSKTAAVLKKGRSLRLTTSLIPAYTPFQAITWQSRDPKIASVKDGVVTGHKPGRTVIIAHNGQFTAKCPVYVSGTAAKSVKLNYKKLTLKQGAREKLKATISPSDVSHKELVWKSSNPSVVVYSTSGYIQARKPGRAVITVTTEEGGKTAKCIVTVQPKVSGVKLSKKAATLHRGETLKLWAGVLPADAMDKRVAWKSSIPKIATVTAKGTVQALSKGRTKIFVTTNDGRKRASCLVTVV